MCTRPRRAGLRADRGATAWIRRPADRDDVLRRPRPARPVRALGAARPRPDASAPPLPSAQLLVRQRRDAARLRRALDAHVLPRALPPADRRLQRAPERSRARAGVGGDVRALTAHGPAVDALRPALLHGRRPADRRGRRRRDRPPRRDHLLLAGTAPAPARLLLRPVADRGTADVDGARRGRGARRGDRERREQRRRPRRRSARHRCRRSRHRRPRQPPRPLGLPARDDASPPCSLVSGASSASPESGTHEHPGPGGRDRVRPCQQAVPRPRRRGAPRALARDPGRDVLRARRTVRGREDHRAQDGQPPDPVRLRRHHDRRTVGSRSARRRAASRHRLRDPADRSLPAHDGRRQRRHRPATRRLEQGAHPRPDDGAARARGARSRGREAVPGRALGRATPARRARARAGRRPAAAADGRAVRRARSDHASEASGRAAAPPPRRREDDHLRDARRRRGDHDGRPDRDPPRGRSARAVRHARRDPRAPGGRVRDAVRRRGQGAAAARAPDARERRARAARRRVGSADARAQSTTLRNAVSLMVGAGADRVVVVDGDDRPVGMLRLQRIEELL